MGQLIIGDHTYGQSHIARRGNMNNVIIGKYCSIAINLVLDCGFDHNTEFISTYPFKSMKDANCEHVAVCKGDIIIGNDVWIGEDVLIKSGVTIGDGAIIGAKSVVTKDVPAYSIHAGIPNKIIKSRFEINQVQKLMQIKWWEWPDKKVIENAHLLNSKSINEFIEKHA